MRSLATLKRNVILHLASLWLCIMTHLQICPYTTDFAN